MENKRDPLTVDLYRPNTHIHHSVWRDVWEIVEMTVLAFLVYCIMMLVLL